MDAKSIAHRFTPTMVLTLWIGIAILFGLAYTQSPLYEGNQNTKFLHGLARAGTGYLQDDWLANTVDPLPVFSGLVAITALINPNLFYLEYFIMFGIYVFSLWGILTLFSNAQKNLTKQVLFLGLIFLYHAQYILWWVNREYGLDLSLLHNGVALQYMLGLEFQTNVFGVLLLLSIYLFLRQHYIWSIVLIGVSAIFHPAYLFSSALLTSAYGLILFWKNLHASEAENKRSLPVIWHAARQPVVLGAIALILVLPVIIYNQTALAATSPETYAQAMHLLVYERIPHHSLLAVWLGTSAYIQIGIILVGILLARKSRLGVIMLVLFISAAILSVVQMVTGSLTLAAIAPWRVSVLLVPLSTAIILAAVASRVVDLLRLDQPWLRPITVSVVLLMIAALAYSGNKLQQTYGTSFRDKRVTDMMDFVSKTKKPGELYLIPPKEPDLNNFRIYTGAPIFINWKSHPYKDTDVLEWYHRVQVSLDFYDAQFSDPTRACVLLDEIVQQYGVTDVVVKRKDAELTCDFVHPTYVETKFTVFAVDRP